jgi:hypothetical protein
MKTLELAGYEVPIEDVDDVQVIVDVCLKRHPPYSPEKYTKAVAFAQLWLATWAEHCAIMDRQQLTGGR